MRTNLTLVSPSNRFHTENPTKQSAKSRATGPSVRIKAKSSGYTVERLEERLLLVCNPNLPPDVDNTIGSPIVLGEVNAVIVRNDELPVDSPNSFGETSDVDMYSFTVSAGQEIFFDFDRNNGEFKYDSYFRLFKADGTSFGDNDDAIGLDENSTVPQESAIQRTFVEAGTYYLGVSSGNNIRYDPITGCDKQRSLPAGAYILTITPLNLPPAAFVVNSTGDAEDKDLNDGKCLTTGMIDRNGDGTPDEPECTLRAAIQAANINGDLSKIHFDMPPGQLGIAPLTDLPRIVTPMVIDGATDPDFRTSEFIVLDGGRSGENPTLLTYQGSSGATIRNLIIQNSNFVNGLRGYGIRSSGSGLRVEGVRIQLLQVGISLGDDADNNIIGGPNPAYANIIVDNSVGIELFGDAVGNVIEGNYIGTDWDGSPNLGNKGEGILVGPNNLGSPSDNTLRSNTIAHNGAAAIEVDGGFVDPTGITIRQNSIYENRGIGIDLIGDGGFGAQVTPNDPGDLDRFQNYPVLLGARIEPTTGSTVIVGHLDSRAGTAYLLDFYSSPSCASSGFGQGKTFLGTLALDTPPDDGFKVFVVNSLDLVRDPTPGEYITATATEADGNTSEFSRCVRYGDDDADGQMEAAGTDGNGDGTDDSEQAQVTTLPTTLDQQATLVAGAGLSLALVRAVDNPSPADSPPGVAFPMGFVDYFVDGLLPGGTTTVDLLLPAGLSVNSYYLFGPTLDNPAPHWFEFNFDGTTGAEVNGDRVTLHFVDGGRGDLDLTINGQIRDPGAPAVKPPDTTPPTLENVPSDMTVSASTPDGEVVNFAPPIATDDIDPAPDVSCDPASGSTFPVGATTVTCTATDDAGNSAAVTFLVTVLPPDTTGPTIQTIDLIRDAKGKKVLLVVLTFSETLNGPGAETLANYSLVSRKGTKVKPAPLLAVIYDNEARSVTLVPVKTISVSRLGSYELTVFGDATLTDASPSLNRLDGDTNAAPGGNFVRALSAGTPRSAVRATVVDALLESKDVFASRRLDWLLDGLSVQ